MASRQLAAAARRPGGLPRGLRRLLAQVPAGDAALAGRDLRPGAGRLLGHADLDAATDVAARDHHRARRTVDGVKISLLDAEREIALRRRLPAGVRLLHRRRLQLPGADRRRRAGPLATRCWASSTRSHRRPRPRCAGSTPATRPGTRLLAPTVPLSRHLFAAPTPHYKTGIVFLAWLDGHQPASPWSAGCRPAAARRTWPHLPARRRGRGAARPGPGRGADAAAACRRGRGAGAVTDRLSLNQATTKDWSFRRPSPAASARGSAAIGLWRERSPSPALDEAAQLVADAGLRVSSLCRGGFFTGADRAAALADNRRALDEAAALGAPCLVMVVGGLPAGSRDLVGARDRVADAIGQLVPHARDAACGSRWNRCTRCSAPTVRCCRPWGRRVELAVAVPGGGRRGRRRRLPRVVGPGGARRRSPPAGERIASYQVCDWVLPLAADALLSRGLPGDGVIDIPALTRSVARPATPATSRSRSSTPTSGPPTATPPWPRWSAGTPSWWRRT